MKFIAYSDPHVHPHQSYSKALPGGMNSRLVDIIGALDQIYVYANENHLPVVCGGDIFQVKNAANVLSFNEVNKIFHHRSGYIQPGESDILCVGNHDEATHDGKRHALEPFSKLPGFCVPLSSDPMLVSWDKHKVIFVIIPYQMENGHFCLERFQTHLKKASADVSAECFNDRTKILVSHLFTNELMKKHLDRDGDFSGKKLLNSPFDLVLLGHHHVHDVIAGRPDDKGRSKKVISIGSPVQLTASERGDKKGFLVIDTDTLDFEFIPLAAPEFHYFDGEKTIITDKIKDDFVRVTVKSKAEATRVEKKLKTAGVAEYKIEIIPERKDSRIDITAGAKDEDIIPKYVESEWGKSELDTTELIKQGMKYLS